MNNFGWDIISYFFMCALSIAATPQNRSDMRVSIYSGYAMPYPSTIVIRRQNGVYKLKRWSRADGASWAVIRSETVTEKGRKYTRYVCRDSHGMEAFSLPGLVPDLKSLNIRAANAATLRLYDGHTTISMRRDGRSVRFEPSPVLARDIHVRGNRVLHRSRWAVTF